MRQTHWHCGSPTHPAEYRKRRLSETGLLRSHQMGRPFVVLHLSQAVSSRGEHASVDGLRRRRSPLRFLHHPRNASSPPGESAS
ncbi:hypothetical protein [Vibrio phage VP882]|uniref:Uncharacterized protein n=1 Tax=Vibrio phage VP882 TaxID=2913982 RepID=A2I2W5_9CAUD|nr:hypothetical protein VPVV882_gp03 [Vibrio phage VP882]ABM73378.1 hypothetical protein [Vibrio phage VP882]TOE71971.1 hypothetical protein CGJ36_22675 [Vibrio parahaemolyticus]